MAWKHIPDNEEAWLYYQEGLLYHGSTLGCMICYPDLEAWTYKDWMEADFDGNGHRKNYIHLED